MKKRMLSLLCVILTVASCMSALCLLRVGAADVPVFTNTGTRTAIRCNEAISFRARVNGSFTGFGFAMPTWNERNSACRLSLYAWRGTVEDTVAQEPLATKYISPVNDNMTHWVTHAEMPAGEYLFRISEPKNSVGVWAREGVKNTTGFFYNEDDTDTENGRTVPELTLRFADKPDTPFLPCTAAAVPPDGNHTPPAAYVIPDDSTIRTHEVMPDTWVFTDGLGRVSLTNKEVGDPRDDKSIAMFYWTWHTEQNASPSALNIQQFLEAHPDAVNSYHHAAWPRDKTYMNFWNEPIYGYYRSTDAWVLRRQGELLANAGVDAVVADNTNETYTWKTGYTALFKTWSEAMQDGVKTPQFAFMLPFAGGNDTKTQLRELYLNVYRKDRYQPLWYYLDGKPLILAHVQDSGLSKSDPVEKEVLSFFTFRNNNPNYTGTIPTKGWGWLSIYPQATYYRSLSDKEAGRVEQMTVGVAQNYNYVLGQLAAMNGEYIMGRSFTSDYKDRFAVEGSAATQWGYNFAEQWQYALSVDPRIVFVTGWNEWIAGRYEEWIKGTPNATKNALPDQCNDEFSRDVEPSTGALKDHYYYQLVNFIRQYKGARPIPAPSNAKVINIKGDNAQWAQVQPYYAAYIGNTDDRDAQGSGTLRYTEYSGRNDIIGARVARDDEYMYFYVECNDTITSYTDPLWMTLYLDTDQDAQGWETFDYVINKTSPQKSRAYLERFTGNGYETQPVGEVRYTVSGRYMQIMVPKSMLGLTGHDFTVNFTWTDNVHDATDAAEHGDSGYTYTAFSGDIMNFYISGDVAPGARFKYSYISTQDNAGTLDTTESRAVFTDRDDLPDTEQDTASTVTEAPTQPSDTNAETPTEPTAPGGCRSSVHAVLLTVVTAGCAVGWYRTHNKRRNSA